MKALDLTGHRFGKLVAIEVVYTDNKRKWFCKCDCGGELKATAGELRGGNFKSCGCLNTRNQEQVKLNVEKVRQIKYFLTTKFTCDEIATAYGVSTGTIRAIKRGDRWADVA